MILYKWYFDIISPDGTSGYYYLMCLEVGGFSFGASAIYHFSQSREIHSFQFSRIQNRYMRIFKLSTGELILHPKSISLKINHGKFLLSGTWKASAKPLRRLRKPLFENRDGYCDWKVVAPLAKASIRIHDGISYSEINGQGYVDFVRLSIPPWKIPFQKLYWGRLHHETSWMILFCLKTSNGILAHLFSKNLENEICEISLSKPTPKSLPEFHVLFLSSDKLPKIVVKALLEYESLEILDRGVMRLIIPGFLRKKIGSMGYDRKFKVETIFDGKLYSGIMEEVTWNQSARPAL